MQRLSWGTGAQADSEAGVSKTPSGDVEEMMESEDGAQGRGQAWVGAWKSV